MKIQTEGLGVNMVLKITHNSYNSGKEIRSYINLLALETFSVEVNPYNGKEGICIDGSFYPADATFEITRQGSIITPFLQALIDETKAVVK